MGIKEDIVGAQKHHVVFDTPWIMQGRESNKRISKRPNLASSLAVQSLFQDASLQNKKNMYPSSSHPYLEILMMQTIKASGMKKQLSI